MMSALPPTSDDRAIWDLWQAQFYLPVATVADEVGTFKALSEAALTTDELAAQLDVDARALSIHLAALCAAGLVEKREGKWRASAVARTWLHPEGEGYWGGFCRTFSERTLYHAQLLETLRTGTRPEDSNSGAHEWERGEMSAEAAQKIAAFMHSHSVAAARGAAAQPVFGEIASLADIGCGSGVYGIEIARANPGLEVTLMDLSAMCDAAQAYIDRAGMGERVKTAPVNMFTEDWPTGIEAHFFSNVFHDWSEETNRLIAKKSFAALPSGGRIFLNEVLMNDDGAGPWPAAAFSLLMLAGTLGKQYSLPEFRTILESAGFTDIEAVSTGGGYFSLVSARKP
ncbi:MAG TPA: methyltransferase [Alteraurantiacibacter sp.]